MDADSNHMDYVKELYCEKCDKHYTKKEATVERKTDRTTNALNFMSGVSFSYGLTIPIGPNIGSLIGAGVCGLLWWYLRFPARYKEYKCKECDSTLGGEYALWFQ